VEGRNIVIEYRWAEGRIERCPALAAELLCLKVDLIVAGSTPQARAAKPATITIPIVVMVMHDPVKDGLVASLARPGGNVTGLTFLGPELVAKRLAVLNWYMLAGAMEELGRKPDECEFVETWSFNSNKCFAVFKP